MTKILHSLKLFNELVVFKHTVFAVPFILISMVVASSGWFGYKLLILGILAAFSARNFAMSINRFMDIDIDAKNPRTMNRPSVDGRLNTKFLLSFIFINAIAFVVISYFINSLAFYLSVPFLIVLAFYSYTKHFSALSHIFIGVCLGLAPIAGAIAILEYVPLWALFLSAGVVFWVGGFDILYSLQDIEFDRRESLYSMPCVLGEHNSIMSARLFHIVAIISWTLFAYSANLGFLSFMGIFICGLILFYEHLLVARDFKNIPKAFFNANGYVSVVLFVFCTLDQSYFL